MPVVDAPDETVAIATILDEIDAANRSNAEVDRLVAEVEKSRQLAATLVGKVEAARLALATLEKALVDANQLVTDGASYLENNVKAKRIAVEPIRLKLDNVEKINDAVRAKAARDAKAQQVAGLRAQVVGLSQEIDRIDSAKVEAMARAKLPVAGLSFNAEGVKFNGIPFEQCASSEQLRVSVAVGAAANPDLRLMLVKDGPLLDDSGMAMLAAFAEQKDMQVLVERIDDGREIGVVIEDGTVSEVRTESEEVASV